MAEPNTSTPAVAAAAAAAPATLAPAASASTKSASAANPASVAAADGAAPAAEGGVGFKTAAVSFLKESWIVILIVCCMILLVLIVVYIFYIIKQNHLQKVILHKDIINLNNRSVVPYMISNSDATLQTLNGQEFSYSMWLFLSNSLEITNLHKVILQRGNSLSGDLYSNTTSPLVVMDRTSNSLSIGISTTKATTLSSTLETIFSKDATTQKYTSGYLISNISYVPLQRWVNIIVVVKDMNVYIYLDGDIYSIMSISELSGGSSATTRYIIRGTSGDIKLGDSKNPTQGYMSLTQFFNYGLTQKDVTAIYNNGPSKKSWLSVLGLGNYGMRSPVYKIN